MCEEFNSLVTSVFTREDLSNLLPEADNLINIDHKDVLFDKYFSQDEMFQRIT